MNKSVAIIMGIIVAVIILFFCIAFGTRNSAINREEDVESAQSNISVQEKRRTDLIYNLADCVKAYDKHEYNTLMDIVKARNNGKNVSADNISTEISAVAEQYPELKSNENYKELMNELSVTENHIADYRETYNDTVRSYKKFLRQFPNSMFLAMTGYDGKDYKYLEYSEKDTEPISGLFNEDKDSDR